MENKIISSNPLYGSAIAGLISNLAPQKLFLGGLPLDAIAICQPDKYADN